MTEEEAQASDRSGAASGESQAERDDVSYLFMTVKVIRGREAATKTKWQDQGWEFVSQTQGALRSEINFRKVKPKGFLAYVAQGYGAFRRLNPKVQLGLLAGLGALVLVGVLGVVVGTLRGTPPSPAAAPITAAVTPSAEPATSTTGLTEPSASPTRASGEGVVTDITVDKLADKLVSANMGGMKVGDRFRVTGELVGSDFWTTGASGDFFVTLKTKSGADLIVFVEESDADGWQDGTKVEMVMENVEVTINGETTDGWFEARSVKTL